MSSKADEIRSFVLDRYVRPWRSSREKYLSVRAGDVGRDMGLHNATPNVCSALEGRKLHDEAGIVLVRREGPRRSTTTTFHYESRQPQPGRPAGVEDAPALRPGLRPASADQPMPRSANAWSTADLCLVSCVSVKRPHAAPAQDLYISTWFRKARSCVEALGCPWHILSAKHGLLDPGKVIAPYNETLKTMPIRQRRTWSDGVIKDLDPYLASISSVTLFAGAAYREFLEPALQGRGLTVYVPMRGLKIGQQVSWLSEQVR